MRICRLFVFASVYWLTIPLDAAAQRSVIWQEKPGTWSLHVGLGASPYFGDLMEGFSPAHLQIGVAMSAAMTYRLTDQLGMGYVFEELIHKFNQENNEEAGEHFTPREVIDLMTHLIFEPIKDRLPPVMCNDHLRPGLRIGWDADRIPELLQRRSGADSGDRRCVPGKETNDKTYAICKSDKMIKSNDLENIKNGSAFQPTSCRTPFRFYAVQPALWQVVGE